MRGDSPHHYCGDDAFTHSVLMSELNFCLQVIIIFSAGTLFSRAALLLFCARGASALRFFGAAAHVLKVFCGACNSGTVGVLLIYLHIFAIQLVATGSRLGHKACLPMNEVAFFGGAFFRDHLIGGG
jgi:hypothetical protein